MMNIVSSFGKDDLAKVYIAEFDEGRVVEFVESVQPPIPREDKWVLIVSTSFGCPVRCMICDAGGSYKGRLSTSQILAQIDYLVLNRYPDLQVPAKKFKIQFARMGEPSLNPNVLEVLCMLNHRINSQGIMPCISTIAPSGTEMFFEGLLRIKNDLYGNGKLQLQFSIHSTNEKERDWLMPVPKWTLREISQYGSRFYQNGDRKITLNFALAQEIELDALVMRDIFSPDHFMIKITPVNPTYSAVRHGFHSYISPNDLNRHYEIVDELRSCGFDTLVSIGENEENLIGSNCGQFVTRHYTEQITLANSYTYADRLSSED